MSGHSKWSTIKRKKAATDAKRGAIFTRIIKEITVAARLGGGDAATNPRLRLAINSAKGANMPSSNIERAIKKGTGDLPGVRYEALTYEGYGPGGAAIMLDVLTDNKKRSVADIRHIMDKNGGNLGESGSVAWQFELRGVLTFPSEGITEDDLFDVAVEYDAEDIEEEDGHFIISVAPDKAYDLRQALIDANLPEATVEIGLEPTTTIEISGSDAQRMLKLIDDLEENEDIEKVSANCDISEADLEEYAG